MTEPIITVSGFRGIVGESLTPEMAIRYAAAFANGLPAGKILMSRDSRTTGAMLADAIRSGLCATGRSVIDAGIAATPTTGILVRETNAAGAIQISASHNPAEYNGFKLFSGEGRVLTANDGAKVSDRYHSGEIQWVGHREIGHVEFQNETLDAHQALILANVDVDRIRARRFKVLVDCNHGAAGPLAESLLEALGCDVTFIGREPNGLFRHRPEPTAENLRDVCKSAREGSIDVGFCPDPDGDRLALLDEEGRYIGEEYTLALSVDHVLRHRKGAIVTNTAASRMSQELARSYGVPFYRAPVGEANVVEQMRRHDAVFGGEGNGGPIDPRIGYVRDSFVGMATILDALASRGMKLSQWVTEIPRYEIRKQAISFDRDLLPSAVAQLIKQHDRAILNESAGYRFEWDDKWLLLHPSNTEPILRIIAEAKSSSEAEQLCDQTADLLKQL